MLVVFSYVLECKPLIEKKKLNLDHEKNYWRFVELFTSLRGLYVKNKNKAKHIVWQLAWLKMTDHGLTRMISLRFSHFKTTIFHLFLILTFAYLKNN